MTLLFMSSQSSVDRVSARRLEGHGLDSSLGLRFFLAHVMMIDSPFTNILSFFYIVETVVGLPYFFAIK